jgi:hypothetical protein
MNSTLWGPSAWNFIHSVCYGAPEVLTYEDVQSYKNFFYSLQNVLPCPVCRQHYKDNLSSVPMHFRTRDELFAWSVELHNSVNKMLGKRQYTVKEALKKFEENNGRGRYTLLFLLLTCVLVYLFFKKSIL